MCINIIERFHYLIFSLKNLQNQKTIPIIILIKHVYFINLVKNNSIILFPYSFLNSLNINLLSLIILFKIY